MLALWKKPRSGVIENKRMPTNKTMKMKEVPHPGCSLKNLLANARSRSTWQYSIDLTVTQTGINSVSSKPSKLDIHYERTNPLFLSAKWHCTELRFVRVQRPEGWEYKRSYYDLAYRSGFAFFVTETVSFSLKTVNWQYHWRLVNQP